MVDIKCLLGDTTCELTGYPYHDLPGGWEKDVLGSLQAPVTVGNVHFLDSWRAAEFGGTSPNYAKYNPFATSLSTKGSTSFNSADVQNYPDWPSGLQATIQTLQSGAKTYKYQDILDKLQSGSIQVGEDVYSPGLAYWSGGTYGKSGGDIDTSLYPNYAASTSFHGAPTDPLGGQGLGGPAFTQPSQPTLPSKIPWAWIVISVLVLIFVVIRM